jgi:D-methionine transport system substrate-binding protein
MAVGDSYRRAANPGSVRLEIRGTEILFVLVNPEEDAEPDTERFEARFTDGALLTEAEEKYLPRANVVAVHGDNVDADLTKALVAAVTSQQVKDYITDTYAGAVISVVENPTDGYDPDVDYDALAGQTITIAATPAPHAQILEIVKQILAEKDITLDIAVYSGYTEENPAVDAGDVYANYFQHQPYLDDYVAETGGNVVTVAVVHTEPMGLYGGKQADLSALGK